MKKELQVPRGIIPHTFVSPLYKPEAEVMLDNEDSTSDGWYHLPDDAVPVKGDTVYWKRLDTSEIINGEFVQYDGEEAIVKYQGQKLHLPINILLMPNNESERDGEAPPERIDLNNEQFA